MMLVVYVSTASDVMWMSVSSNTNSSQNIVYVESQPYGMKASSCYDH